MDIKSIKQIAEEQNVSYEAIRKQIARYSEELKDHIIRKNRTQYIDQWGYEFLKEKRRENPIILMNMDQNEQLEELKVQVEFLKNQLLESQKKVIELQEENQKSIESKIRYEALLETTKEKDERLKDAQEQIQDLRSEGAIKAKEIDDLKKERDEALEESQSFKKSILGFYRKK